MFDLDAGPATVTLPDGGDRFMSMQVIDEDHYTHAVNYGAGRHASAGSRSEPGMSPSPCAPSSTRTTRLTCLQCTRCRTQSRSRRAAVGSFEIPDWDPLSQKTVRDALVTLATTLPDTKDTFGTKEDTDPVRHLIGSANAWGGNPQKDALYLTVVPQENDGSAAHRLTVGEVPVDAFWSVTVYTKDGYLAKNPQDAYSFNNVTARKGPDGSTTIQFGGCDGNAPNCLPITPGWNYTVRLYRPRQEILDGSWVFPEAQPV